MNTSTVFFGTSKRRALIPVALAAVITSGVVFQQTEQSGHGTGTHIAADSASDTIKSVGATSGGASGLAIAADSCGMDPNITTCGGAIAGGAIWGSQVGVDLYNSPQAQLPPPPPQDNSWWSSLSLMN